MSDASRSRRPGRVLLVGAIAAALAACGSSNQQPAASASQPSQQGAYGGGPQSLESTGAEIASPLVSSVSSAVPGLSPSQTSTGTGALLGLAQQKMPADQFGKITQAIPETEALIGSAHKQGLPSSGLNDRSALRGVFQKVGITPVEEALLVPAVQNEISKAAGPTIGEAFAAAVK